MLGLIGRALRHWRPYGKQGLLIVLCLLLQQGFSTYLALSLKLILDSALHGGGGAAALVRVLATLGGGFVLAALATLAGDYLSARVGAGIVNDLRREMFAHLQRLSLDYYARARTGDLVSRFVSDVADLEKGLVERLLDGVCAVLGLLLNLPLLFFLEWRLALLAMLLLLLLPLGTRRVAGLAAAASYHRKGAEAELASTVQEQVRVQPVIRAFGLADLALDRFRAQLHGLGRRMVREGFLGALVGTSSSLGVLLVQLLVIAAGSYLALRGRLSAGALVAVVSLLGNLTKDAYTLTKKVAPSLLKASGGLRRVDELLAEAPEPADAPGVAVLPRLRGELGLRGVRFSHGGGRPHLSDVSFTIPAGARVALVGPSGCGKSTVLGLLLRFYDPDDGAVLADGHDLRRVSRASLRAQLGVVLQEPMLLNASVRENIRLGRPGAPDADVEAAARAAEIHEAIRALPEGYDTPIGELGGRLSGGQRQRLAIARALLRDPAVLLLDEPTAALDAGTEALVLATLARLGQGRTVVCATHRLGFARDADLILVLDGGRLVEEGRHEALLARGGLYHRLWHAEGGAPQKM